MCAHERTTDSGKWHVCTDGSRRWRCFQCDRDRQTRHRKGIKKQRSFGVYRLDWTPPEKLWTCG